MTKQQASQLALRFVIIVGVVNLFADLTYEGARSVNGAFLASLGASAIAVGFVSGFGELVGYGLRSITGFFASKSHQYWMFAFIGYAINVLAVPALALADNWPTAAALIIAERTGRAIRKPSVETMLSFSGREIGSGWVFGLNEFFDQFGATVGPLIVALILLLKGNYRDGYAALLVSALLCLALLVVARIQFPKPQDLDKAPAVALQTQGFSRSYWLFVLAGGLIAAGFTDFSLIAFHFETTRSIGMQWIPILYAIAMATAGISALLLGRLLDTLGSRVLLGAMFLGAFFTPFVFLGGLSLAIIGMVLWGVGMGAQDSLLKAALATMVPPDKRSTAFGVFDTGFGIAWFIGSGAMGIIYTHSIIALIIFSVVLQLAALPVFALATRRLKTA